MNFSQRPKAEWVQANDHFLVSKNGSIKPDTENQAYTGNARFAGFISPDTAAFILANLDAFKQAVEKAQGQRVEKQVSKLMSDTVTRLMKAGLDEATAIEQAKVIIKKQSAA